MNYDYEWALNKIKLGRAVSWAKDQKKLDAKFEVTEEVVKERYVKLGGKLLEVASPVESSAGGETTPRTTRTAKK